MPVRCLFSRRVRRYPDLRYSVIVILDLTPQQRAFRESIETFARESVAPYAAAVDESGEFPEHLFRAAADRGLAGITIPQNWGGLGLDYVSYVLAIETLAQASATLAVSLVVHNSLVGELIAHAGRGRHKDQWLRKMTSGEAIGAFALSEPDAGTDAANQQTRAVKTAAGYRVTGRKIWVANAEAAAVAICLPAAAPGSAARA